MADSIPRKYRTVHFQQAKDAGRRFAMLTSYDAITAGLFDQSGIEMLLIGDSVGNTVLGHSTTLPVTLDDIITFSQAVVRGTERAFVVADLPFGSYEISPAQAVESAVRLVKESGVSAVKIEGGAAFADHVRALVAAGVAVIGHIGFTPQSENVLGGYRIQGRGDDAAGAIVDDAVALQEAGAFAILMEMVPADVARRVDEALRVPTIGIGAGPHTTGQVLVWQDMLGLREGKMARFVKQYAQLHSIVTDAVSSYHREVLDGSFPSEEHGY
ncbi:MAG: 3-methyl-2-oxobutanoate hydroxymethyltransferase [Micrococcaceae bacterium]